METRTCRNTGLELSVLGIGCWAFGGGEYWGPVDQQDVNRIVATAVDSGITYFDTAESYNDGRSETSLGQAIRGIPRDRIIIGSKVSPSNCYYQTLPEHCEGSLRRLGTDYLDVYMIHWPIHPHAIRHYTDNEQVISHPPAVSEAIEALDHLKEQGKIRHWGVSNFGVDRLRELPPGSVAVNQLAYNLLCRAIEHEALPFCSGQGIGVIAYMAVFQGILADLYKNLDEVPAWYRRTRHFSSAGSPKSRHGEQGFEEETGEALTEIRGICRESGMDMPELAIKWVLANQDIQCALAGSRKVKKIRQNIAAAGEPLNLEIKQKLDRATLRLREAMGPHFDYFEAAANDRT